MALISSMGIAKEVRGISSPGVLGLSSGPCSVSGRCPARGAVVVVAGGLRRRSGGRGLRPAFLARTSRVSLALVVATLASDGDESSPSSSEAYVRDPEEVCLGGTGAGAAGEELLLAPRGVSRDQGVPGSVASDVIGVERRGLGAGGEEEDDEEDESGSNNLTLFSATWMSFLWSMGSFMVLSLLPVYLREHLGFSLKQIGALEGMAVVASALAKGLSGVLSDLIGSRKLVLLFGSAMTMAIKPLFALSPLILTRCGSSVALASVSSGKILDRLGKGIRAAPFDALISDVSPVHKRGRAYGLNYSASTFGAVCGCLAASLLMKWTGNSYSISLAFAVFPPLVATLILWRFVTEERSKGSKGPAAEPGSGEGGAGAQGGGEETMPRKFISLLQGVRTLPMRFWQALLIVCVLYLARFSESFMTIRARSIGMSVSKLPLLLIIDQLMQSTLTYPMGALADIFGRKYLLLFGFGFLICANVIFMTSASAIGMISGYFLVGLHMSMTQCNLKALLSTTIPNNMRGSAFSIVGLATGSCLFLGNIMAGQLMDITISHGRGHIGAFIWGLVATCLATFALIYLTFIDDCEEYVKRRAGKGVAGTGS
ncbi:MFS general substrate transporter [Chloropicon primus]|uniref:MFS general substrate transporter n=1 Tax=Chloropicon primus TaxID=1764295 RepID=A0A5B8MXG3_9CHLO|nr:MFS general substrate transporter [Chloropicon primus]UPR04695.1 MFS general substrate transporter [Chloropicon primus]|eukprot:QDZ25498.1 MFS general substrate transporter [Chloropicon primus]